MQIWTGGNGNDNQNKNHIGLLYRQVIFLHINHTDNYLNKDMLNVKRPPIPVPATSKGVGLRPFACWDCGFETHRGHGSASLMSVVCCQVEEVSASGWSLVESGPTEFGVSEYDREASIMRSPGPLGGDAQWECKETGILFLNIAIS
jgi:hypothetical protein